MSKRACARKTAADSEKTKCCKQGESKVRYPKYTGFDYCTGMPDGAVCWLDKMCKSKSCKGNSVCPVCPGGTSKGKCSKVTGSFAQVMSRNVVGFFSFFELFPNCNARSVENVPIK